MLSQVYRPSLALLTDLYQLTMAYAYWKTSTHKKEAVFTLYFRSNPFKGGYAVASGLEDVVEYLEKFRFDPEDLEYLKSLRGNDGKALFSDGFLQQMGQMENAWNVDAIPEGTAVFANEPLVRVRGPILQCQLLETPLLNLINFQTLIATKSARICQAARGQPVIEFGLRRAQGIGGALSASRAAYIGGCAATSNLLAGRLLGIPVRGTHAHSWVMSFEDEAEAFDAYAGAMANNVVFLVDTYNTLEGVRKAARIGRGLAAAGHRMIGIRLDSGDLAWLSVEARKILDEAGLKDADILATNDLDEHLIENLKNQGAAIDSWGVGTRLVTAYDQPALAGIYKLTAIREAGDRDWRYPVKLSEQVAKTSIPGVLQVRRYSRDGQFLADAIYNEPSGIATPATIVDPKDLLRFKTMPANVEWEDLLVPIFRDGRRVYELPELESLRRRTADQIGRLHPSIVRLANPHEYPVGLERRLSELRTERILAARQASQPIAQEANFTSE